MKLNRGVILVIVLALVGIAILLYQFARPPRSFSRASFDRTFGKLFRRRIRAWFLFTLRLGGRT
jgi:hypothetical protein